MRLLEGLPDLDAAVEYSELPIAVYVNAVQEEVASRWHKLATDPVRARLFEVVGSQLARGGSLACQLVANESYWTVSIGRMVLRAIADNHISMSWIMEDVESRSAAFRDYGLGQQKLNLAHLQDSVAGTEMEDRTVEQLQDEIEWLNSQRWEHFVDINLGSWSGKTTRSMAEEVGLLELYRTAFSIYSSSVHSTWNLLAQENLAPCRDPLHGGHQQPVVTFEEERRVYFCWTAACMFDAQLRDFDRRLGFVEPRTSFTLIDDCFPRLAQEQRSLER